MKLIKKSSLCSLVFFFSIICLNAGGFRVSLQGVKQASMGHTGASYTEDASAIAFNPAGLAFQKTRWSVSVHGFGIAGKAKYQNRETLDYAQTSNPVSTPVAIYASYKPMDYLSVGLGAYTPFGSIVQWPKNWAGQTIVTKTKLKALFIQPTLAVKIAPWASLGGGVIYALGSAYLDKNIRPIGGNVVLESDKKPSGMGYTFGLMLKPSKQLQVGVNYRSDVKMKARNGKARFEVSNVALIDSPFGDKSPIRTKNDRWDADFKLPSELSIGITYKPIDDLMLSFETNFVKWDVYKTMSFKFKQNKIGNNPKDRSTLSSKRNYKNTRNYRFGIEYKINKALVGRLGYYYDENPSPSAYFSPETPTVNQHAITTGIGYNFKNGLYLNLIGGYLLGKERSIHNLEYNFKGDFKTRAFTFGLGVGYNFN